MISNLNIYYYCIFNIIRINKYSTSLVAALLKEVTEKYFHSVWLYVLCRSQFYCLSWYSHEYLCSWSVSFTQQCDTKRGKKKKKPENVVITLLKCFWRWGQEEKSVDVLNVFLEINYGGVSSNSCAVLAYLNSR